MDFDFLVAANPVWEKTWMVDGIPPAAPPEAPPACADGGGSALNSACALAAAGWRVLAAGRVGDDEEGRAALEALRRRGVETRIEIAPGRRTKRNHVYVERGSATTAFQVFVPPLAVQPWEEEPPALLRSTVMLLDRLPAAGCAWLEARRQARGCRNFLNRNSGIGTAAAEERFRRALPHVDYLQIPERTPPPPAPAPPAAPADPARSPSSAPQLLPDIRWDRSKVHRPAPVPPLSDPQVHALMASGLSILIRTRGAAGVLLHTPQFTIAIPAQPTAVVDPTGAGDAFAAGFLDGMLSGLGAEEAARRGVDWAARACRHPGARGWLDHEPPESA